MTRWLSLAALAVLVAAGCNKTSSGPTGKTATADTGKNSAPTAAHLGNKIEIVTSPIRVEKGKTTTIKITATRKNPEGKDPAKETVMYKESWYQGEIKLEFDTTDVPRGATGLKLEPATIPAGKDSVDVPVTAAADATSGMVGITAKGGPGTEPFTIIIQADVR
jgi:hypothetical protein